MARPPQYSKALDFAQAMVEPLLERFPSSYLLDLRGGLERRGIQRAVAHRDTAAIFDWLADIVALQGISDRSAFAFIDKHGNVGWEGIQASLDAAPACSRLRSYWSFSDCGYRKTGPTCAAAELLSDCPLPRHRLRKGALNVAAHSLFFFFRDICDGDIVSWIDARLAAADPGPDALDRGRRIGAALLGPLCEIHGTGAKLWSIALAELLLGGDPGRERWVAAGAGMIAADSLAHNFLVRTGILRRAAAEHPYGSACYGPQGCAELIEVLASRIDARRYHPQNPPFFPRLVQSAIWDFCAQGRGDVCNGNKIDDRHRCVQSACPLFRQCDRVALRPA